jgi:hypothetical protein
VADEPEEKPDGDAPAEGADDAPARETAVGHQVVEAGDAGKPAADEGATEVFFSRAEPEPAGGGDSELNPQPLPPEEAQPAAAPTTPPTGTSPAGADREAAESRGQFEQKPEIYIAGAFVAAFAIGKLFKKLTGGDD